jgi:hypothetical protein
MRLQSPGDVFIYVPRTHSLKITRPCTVITGNHIQVAVRKDQERMKKRIITRPTYLIVLKILFFQRYIDTIEKRRQMNRFPPDKE